jgi:hypothetical protein
MKVKKTAQGWIAAHLCPTMYLSRSSDHYVYGRPGNCLVFHEGALQPEFPDGDDLVSRNAGLACVAAENGLRDL